MPIIKLENEFADADFGYLRRHLNLLDLELNSITAAISASSDPDSDGLLDAGEYFIGHGLVAVQRYMATVWAAAQVPKFEALNSGLKLADGAPFAMTVNAGANYWKHLEEWFERRFSDMDLQKNAIKTIEQIEAVTPIADYTCSKILASLTPSGCLELSLLLPRVSQWRGSIFELHKNLDCQ